MSEQSRSEKLGMGSESIRLSGVVLLRGPETPDEFEGTIVEWRSFLTQEELEFMENREVPPTAQTREEAEQRLLAFMLNPGSHVTEGQIAERVIAKIASLPQNAILVTRDGADVTYFAHLAAGGGVSLPFICIISPGGMTAHGSQVLQETYETSYRKIPPTFLAVAKVEGVRTLKQNSRVKITITGARVSIERL